jgi:DNA sulfur modification protein DndB
MKPVYLPCLRGTFGEWAYFSTVIKVKDAVLYKRIITVPESKELYSSKLNEILQREFDKRRIDKIKNYLLTIKERFFSSLVVAIHKGDPRWSDFDIEERFRVDNKELSHPDINFIENKLGILTLAGTEEIFVLDGQHRLLGLREAYKQDKIIGDDEVSLIIVIHRDKLKEKTRRLFTVLNRYAVKVRPAELVILEEDDAAAILTRKLVDEYTILMHERALSTSSNSEEQVLNKGFGLPPTDLTNFTTLVCLYQINKVLINYNQLYHSGVIARPSKEDLDVMWSDIVLFWDKFFKSFPAVKKFILEGKGLQKFKRNPKTGGSLLLRPEGQLLIASSYKHFKEKGQEDDFWQKISGIDLNLSGPVWNYIFWTGEKIESKNKKLKRELMLFLLGEKRSTRYITESLKSVYKSYNLKYDNHIQPLIDKAA